MAKFIKLDSGAIKVAGSATETLEVGGVTIANGSITDGTGAISFGNENISTTGTLGSGALSVTTASVSSTLGVTGAATLSDTLAVSGAVTHSDALTVQTTALKIPKSTQGQYDHAFYVQSHNTETDAITGFFLGSEGDWSATFSDWDSDNRTVTIDSLSPTGSGPDLAVGDAVRVNTGGVNYYIEVTAISGTSLTLTANGIDSTDGSTTATTALMSNGSHSWYYWGDSNGIRGSVTDGSAAITTSTHEFSHIGVTYDLASVDGAHAFTLSGYDGAQLSGQISLYTKGSVSTEFSTDRNLTVSGTGTSSFAGAVTVSGDLTVSGTTTTVNSTVVSIADPVFELGQDSSDDNLDRGLKMKYNDGAAKAAFMGFDESDGKFMMIANATDTSSVFSGSLGTLKLGTLEVASLGSAVNCGNYALTNVNIDSGDISAATVSGALTWSAAQDFGAFSLTAQTLVADVADGTAPMTITSTTLVANLNADKLDSQEGSYYLDYGNFVIDNGEIAAAKVAMDADVRTFIGTPSSANLAGCIDDETGSGALVFATSPTLVTPALGTPSAGVLTSCTGLPVSSGIAGLDGGVADFLATSSSANLAAAMTDETGSGALVFATSPTLVTPALGTPSAGVLTSCTGLPVSSGISGLGGGVAAFLADPTSAKLIAAMTDESGTDALLFASGPVMSVPQINDSSEDHQYVFAVSELAADRTVTLPLLTGNDEFVFKDHTQTLTNKTFTAPTLADVDIDGGNIDGVTIATSDITVGAGKTLNVSAGTLTLADNQISGDKVEGGTIAAITISAASITALASNMDCGNYNMTNVDIDSGDISGVTVSSGLTWSAAQDLNSQALTNVNMDSGDISAATISGSLTWSAAQDLNSQALTNVNMDSGSVDGATLGAASAAEARVTSMGFAGFEAQGSTAAKDLVYISGAGAITEIANDSAAHGGKVCGVMAVDSGGSASAGKLVMSGPATVSLKTGVDCDAGDPLYLSSEAGKVTSTAPSTGWIIRVGFANETQDSTGGDVEMMVSIGNAIYSAP